MIRLRTNADDRPGTVHFDILALEHAWLTDSGIDRLGKGNVERIRHADMAHDAVFEESPRPHLSSVQTISSSPKIHTRAPPPPLTRAESLPSSLHPSPPPPSLPFPKRKTKLTPLVQSTTPPATKKSLGRTSSLKLPTALKPTAARTPSFLSAATLARLGISWGAYWWCWPWRARKATMVGFDVDDVGRPVEGAGGA